MQFLTDPNVSYFLLVSGFTLAVLALFTPGTGVLELGALFALALAGYGVVNNTINGWALALLIFGVIPFILALRRSQRYIFLAVALLSLVVGSIFLFKAPAGGTAINPFIAAVVSVLSGGLLWYVAHVGMIAMQQPPTINMERYIGQIGEARTDIYREGAVYVGGEEWTARSDVLIPAGSRVQVVGREGLVLLVTPVAPQPAPPPAEPNV
jgi:membrane-bound serine protease (ClpP class)